MTLSDFLRGFDASLWSQFRFAQPLALYALPGIGVLFLLRYLLNRNAGQRLRIAFDLLRGNRPRLRGSAISGLRHLLPLTMTAALAFLLIALARPQIVREVRENQSEGIDLVLAIDVSMSMAETDLSPNRLDAARRVARAFVAGRQNDRIGLVVFAGEAMSLCPLTTDYELLGQYIDNLSTRLILTSGTAIGDALARAINRLRPSTGKSKVVILLSDGDNTAGSLNPETAARLARQFNIRVYTIAVGKITASPDAPATTLSPDSAGRARASTMAVDENTLKSIATIGQGAYFRATDAGQLRQVFARIDKLEKAPIRTSVYQDVQDYYRVYLLAGIGCLLLALFLKNTIVGNILED
jgi:Ca-activated chloride channel homolog